MESLTTDPGGTEPAIQEPPSNTSSSGSRIPRRDALRPYSMAESCTTEDSPATSGSAYADLKELVDQWTTATSRTKLNEIKNITAKFQTFFKLLKDAWRTNAEIQKIQHASPTPTAADSPPPTTPISDMSMRGTDRGRSESPSITWSTPSTSSTCHSSGNQLTPRTKDQSNLKIQHMINELKTVTSIKSTNKRIMSIAASIIEALTTMQKANQRGNPFSREVVRHHEAILAELLRELDIVGETATGTPSFDVIRGITLNLADHWETVKASLNTANPHGPPWSTAKIPLSPPPRPRAPPFLTHHDSRPPLEIDIDNSQPPQLSEIESKLVMQDHKIDEILSFLQKFDHSNKLIPPEPTKKATTSMKSLYRSVYSTPSSTKSPLSPIPHYPTPGSLPRPPSPPPSSFPPLSNRSQSNKFQHRSPQVVHHSTRLSNRRQPTEGDGRILPNDATVKNRPPAHLVKASKSYSEVVRTIKEQLGPTDLGKHFKYFRKSKEGELLIEFANHQDSEDDVKMVRERLSNIDPGVISKVVTLGRTERVEILDIDPASGENEVLEALRAAVPAGQRGKIAVTGLWQTSSGFAKAAATVPWGISSLVKHIKIGYFKCRIRLSTPPPLRCYRCHDHGHIASKCDGPDLSGTCMRCASKGHSTNNCPEGQDRCVACDRWGLPPAPHKPGSAQCGARKRASRPRATHNSV